MTAKETQWVLRVESKLTEVIDKIADNYKLTRSDIIRALLPDLNFLSVLADNPDDINEPKDLLPVLLDGGLRWFMASHRRYPLCAEDLSVDAGWPLYQLFVDFCKAVRGQNVDKGYSLEEISPGSPQTKYKLIHPAKIQLIAPFDVVDEVIRGVVARGLFPPITDEELVKKFGSRIAQCRDYRESQRQTFKKCGMTEEQIENYFSKLDERMKKQ